MSPEIIEQLDRNDLYNNSGRAWAREPRIHEKPEVVYINFYYTILYVILHGNDLMRMLKHHV